MGVVLYVTWQHCCYQLTAGVVGLRARRRAVGHCYPQVRHTVLHKKVLLVWMMHPRCFLYTAATAR